MKNFIQNKVLLHDGIENDFIHKKNFLECPCCSGKIVFSVYGSRSFNSEELDFKKTYSKKIKGVKEKVKGSGRYHYDGEAISFFETECDFENHKVVVFFTFSEIQPSRYSSHLIGLFLKD